MLDKTIKTATTLQLTGGTMTLIGTVVKTLPFPARVGLASVGFGMYAAGTIAGYSRLDQMREERIRTATR